MASGEMTEPPPYYPGDPRSSNTLILVDIKDEIEDFLGKFENTCAGRAKLTGHDQLAYFYALLVFGIAKSILIDAYSIRGDYEEENPWRDTDATAINSAYKALVGCFCWASKSDIILQANDAEGEFGDAIQQTRTLVHHDKWEERGYKGTKDFMLSLGSHITSEGKYNGFFVQKFGLSGLPKNPSVAVVGNDPGTLISLSDDSVS